MAALDGIVLIYYNILKKLTVFTSKSIHVALMACKQMSRLPRMILDSMRWLPIKFKVADLTEKLLEILDGTSKHHQVDVIAALPEIVPAKMVIRSCINSESSCATCCSILRWRSTFSRC